MTTDFDSLKSINMRSINYELAQLYRKMILNYHKLGNGLFGSDGTQAMQTTNYSGISIEHDLGQIVVKNNMDKLQYLLTHKSILASLLGTTPEEIFSYRRDFGKIQEWISKLGSFYDLGDYDKKMQLYISKIDENTTNLENTQNWTNYIMTQDWIDEFIAQSLKTTSDWSNVDYRISYLSDWIQGQLKDHEHDYHKNLEDFDEDLYLDKSEPGQFIDATNKLNSFHKLNYCFYEMFKPIGGTTEKYIKVKVYTNGEMEVSGVLGLSDCELVPWEYGSLDYLRSLNTGNKKYRFNINLPWNDGNSTLYWKPDEKELISEAKSSKGYYPRTPLFMKQARDISESDIEAILAECSEVLTTLQTIYDTDIKNETYQSLIAQWTDITSKIKQLQQDAQSESSEQITEGLQEEWEAAIERLNAIYQTVSEDDDDGSEEDEPTYRYYKGYETERFLRWFGTTSIPSFDLDSITKKTICSIPVLSNDVQSDSFYEDSDNILNNPDFEKANIDDSTSISLLSLAPKSSIDISSDGKYVEFVVSGHQQTSNISFQIEGMIGSSIEEINHYEATLTTLGSMYSQMSEAILLLQTMLVMYPKLDSEWKEDNESEFSPSYWQEFVDDIKPILDDPTFIDLIRVRQIDTDIILAQYEKDLAERIAFIKENYKNLTDEDFTIEPYLLDLCNKNIESDLSANYLKEMLAAIKELDGIAMTFDHTITVDELRTSIQTYNNLIVRLPTDTYINKVTSMHIFLDWKTYVESSLEYLVENNLLWKSEAKTGVGTDKIEHTYYEYYTDKAKTTPLIDYSYCLDSDGNVIHDRFDYWTADDFK